MDIIYTIMRDAADSEGVCAVLQRLINITAEISAECPCPHCGSAGAQLAIDLDAAMQRFAAAIQDHGRSSKSYV